MYSRPRSTVSTEDDRSNVRLKVKLQMPMVELIDTEFKKYAFRTLQIHLFGLCKGDRG